jgi:undecaprenyl diphosphate synthase
MNQLHLPRHIAIIMDGNGRWAKARFLPRIMGHKTGVKRVKELVRYTSDIGVQVLTLYAFSTENWRRPKEEVSFLMKLMYNSLRKEMAELHKERVQFKVIGDISGLNSELQNILAEAEALMADNSGLKLRVAINYGARAEIVRAVKLLFDEVKLGSVNIEGIDEVTLSERLYTRDVPDPDLLIRTGGECRISNFLLWQLAYAEFYFVNTLFPDFNIKELDKALAWYNARERRFGKTSEQVQHEHTQHPN